MLRSSGSKKPVRQKQEVSTEASSLPEEGHKKEPDPTREDSKIPWWMKQGRERFRLEQQVQQIRGEENLIHAETRYYSGAH